MSKVQDEILSINQYIQLDERSAIFGVSALMALSALVVVSGAALAFPEIAKTAIEKLPNLEITKKLTEEMVDKITGIIWGGNIGVGVAATLPALAKVVVNSKMKAIENSVVRSQRPKGRYGYWSWTQDEKDKFNEEKHESFQKRVDTIKEERGIDVKKEKQR